jgi:prepilin-type N-terminal cleavage/methylation domain-containing protein
MKTRLLTSRPKAFTLIEILTVITIIALLGAMGFGGYKVALDKTAKKNTIARMAGLQVGLEAYKGDNGEYPEPLNAEDTTTVGTGIYKVGGARLLYQVMAGDGDSAIKGGGIVSTGIPGSSGGKIYWEEVTAPTQKEVDSKKSKPLVSRAEDGTFYMVDGWRKPFQYIKALKDRNKVIANEDQVHSDADYEIWSYGILKMPLEDTESQKEWIATWNQ